MGIPQFYRWLIENFPKVLENNLNGEIKFNNLYIDMNGIVHNAIKLDNSNNKGSGSGGSPLSSLLTMKCDMSEEKIKENMYYRLDQMIENVNPTSLLYIGVDGVPPRAKAIEQRKRRFKSSKESVDVIIKYLKSKNQEIKRDSIMELLEQTFDSNSISPATEFIEKIDKWIKEYCDNLSIKRPNLSIIISNSTVPGEGEHKIMDYIRLNHSNLIKDGMSHCFYGMDADLIFLGLKSHLPNFYIIRDPISLISCSICKAVDDHTNYECRSAYALKKQYQKKSTSVIVRNLPSSCSERDIHNIFSYYGNIKIEKIEKSNTKRQTLNAYIQFENEDIVNEISTRGSTFTVNNERVSIHVEYLDDVFKPRNEKGEFITDDGEEGNYEKKQTISTDETIKTIEKPEVVDEYIPENAVFVVGLDSNVSRFDITTFFEKFGTVSSFQLMPSPRFHKQQYSMIKFETQEAAQLACKSSGIEFFGTKISIKKAQLQKQNEQSGSGGSSSGTSSKVAQTEEEKLAKEKIKEKKRMIKESKIQSLSKMVEPNTTRETVVFYLGLSSWNIEKAYENYLLFDKAGLEHTILNGKKKKILFDYVSIDSFRSYLEYYLFEKVDEKKREKVDFNRVINDITVMCFLLGNDFLMHLPSVGIQSGSIELILCWYRDWIQSSVNNDEQPNDIKYIVNQDSTHINFENIVPLLESIANWESTLYPDNLEKQVKKDNARSNRTSGSETTAVAAPEFVYDDLIYYKVKLGLMDKSDEEIKKVIDDVCFQYTLGLHWVSRYYTNGCQGWEWFYPYHYSPLAKDLLRYQKRLSTIKQKELVENQFNFKLGSPLPPLVHITSVLPGNSVRFLPEPLQVVMKDPSPFASSYRDDFKMDLNGEAVAWKAIVLLDFMDAQKLKEYTEPIIENQLTDLEKKRNQFGKDYKIKNGNIIQVDHDFVNGSVINVNDEKAIPHVNITAKLNAKDLSYPTRNYFTTSPFVSSDFEKYTSIPQSMAPTTDHNALANITKEQSDYLEWRKVETGFNASMEILQQIDFSKSSCLNIDKKQASKSGASITSWLGRLLNNEYSNSKDSQMFIKSIDDSQLIINIGFKQPVKLNSIKLISTGIFNDDDNTSAPKVVKIYVNNDQPNIDFSVIEGLVPKCTIEYSSPKELESLTSSKPYSFGTTNQHFKSVNNLTIFIESNFSENQNKVSIIEKIILS